MTFDIAKISSQEGRTVVVTGANAGLGKETALALGLKGAKVVMACRNPIKAEAAKNDILQQAPDANLDVMVVDLTSLASVRAFADDFRASHKKIDVLINNAGVMIPPYTKTEDGFELQLGANHLGHFALTAHLIDLMPDTSDSRIVSLSSIAHLNGRINFKDLNSETRYSKTGAYAQSKLACLMFALELDRRLQARGKKMLSVAAHPGVSDTELVRYVPKPLYFIAKHTLMPLVSHKPSEGAKPTLMAALTPDASGGDYFGPTGFREMTGAAGKARISGRARKTDVAARLWEESEQLTGVQFEL